MLNHVSGHEAGVAGVYNRASYRAEKRKRARCMGDFVLALMAERKASNVENTEGVRIMPDIAFRGVRDAGHGAEPRKSDQAGCSIVFQNIFTLSDLQARHLAQRLGVSRDRARLLAPHVFSLGRPA